MSFIVITTLLWIMTILVIILARIVGCHCRCYSYAAILTRNIRNSDITLIVAPVVWIISRILDIIMTVFVMFIVAVLISTVVVVVVAISITISSSSCCCCWWWWCW